MDTDALARILNAAGHERGRLEFLLELSHELRTPAGLVDGYLSLARQGEISIEDAVDIAAIQARELCRLLDGLLTTARAQLRTKEAWDQRVAAAHERSTRLREATKKLHSQVGRSLAEKARAQEAPATAADETADRRNQRARLARDLIAHRLAIDPRTLGRLDEELANLLAARLAGVDSSSDLGLSR